MHFQGKRRRNWQAPALHQELLSLVLEILLGKPLQEPVAWYGPIVMNTQEQLRQASEELERGTFLKH